MRSTVETITPAKAKDYLRRNERNRPVRKMLVERYARDMKAGRWRLTHQGIAFANDGTLLDGQHRLKAIVEANVSVQMLVCRDTDKSAQFAMDDHARRHARDAIALDTGVDVGHHAVAMCRAVVELQGDGWGCRMTRSEVAELLAELKDGLAFAERNMGKPTRGVTSAAVFGAIAIAWYYVPDIDRLTQFCRILTGEELAREESEKAPVLLREWLLRGGVQTQRMREDAFRKTKRAIRAFMDYEPLQRLYPDTSSYAWPMTGQVRGLIRDTSSHRVKAVS